jgi:hypothetical protein
MKLEKEFLQEKAPHLKLRGTAEAPLGEAHATIDAAPSQGSMPAASPLKLHEPKSFETCPQTRRCTPKSIARAKHDHMSPE